MLLAIILRPQQTGSAIVEFFYLPRLIYIYIYFSISFSNKLIVKSFNWIYTITIICTTISFSFSSFNSINLDILLHHCIHYSWMLFQTFNNKTNLVANGNGEFVLVVVVVLYFILFSLSLSSLRRKQVCALRYIYL